jgi:hypothetical protein
MRERAERQVLKSPGPLGAEERSGTFLVHLVNHEGEAEPLKFGFRALGNVAEQVGSILKLLAHPSREHGKALVEWLIHGR